MHGNIDKSVLKVSALQASVAEISYETISDSSYIIIRITQKTHTVELRWLEH